MAGDGPGRATKLTPEREAVILETLKHGGTWEAAAAGAGIGTTTIHKWRQWGEDDPDGLYGAFRERCTRAVAEGEQAAVRAVYAAFTQPTTTTTTKTTTDDDGNPVTEVTERTEPPDAMMALRWLERRRPKGWSPTNITKHIGAVPVEEQAREVRITLVEPAKDKPDGE